MSELHGTQEFGKDFVFSELHRLGGMRHYAAQVKHEKTINRQVDMNEKDNPELGEQLFVTFYERSSTSR